MIAMSLFDSLIREAAGRGLRFIVIGGHAVIAHGFQRGTEDADMLVSRAEQDAWCAALERLGYRMFRNGGTFVQFESDEAGQWDLDMMVVTEDTFERLFATAKLVTLGGAAVAVPSLQHLLALKVHALKHGHGLRVLKDMTDVAQLLLANRVDPKSEWLRELFQKHGDMQLYERVIKLLS